MLRVLSAAIWTPHHVHNMLANLRVLSVVIWTPHHVHVMSVNAAHEQKSAFARMQRRRLQACHSKVGHPTKCAVHMLNPRSILQTCAAALLLVRCSSACLRAFSLELQL